MSGKEDLKNKNGPNKLEIEEFIVKGFAKKKERKDKDIVDTIELFREINNTVDVCFKNKSQRTSAERLVKTFGKEMISKVVKYIKKNRLKEFFPQISTPYELESKGEKLKQGSLAHKPKKDENDLNYYRKQTEEFEKMRDEAIKNH